MGCQPLNIIGTNGASPAARSFVQGLNADGSSSRRQWPRSLQIVDQRQEVFDFGMSGAPFEDWAGKISVATGFQYREEAFRDRDRLRLAGQLRQPGVWWRALWSRRRSAAEPGWRRPRPVLPPIAPNWYAGNFQPARGVFHEWEVFEETNVPLLNDADWGKIDADVAGRYTHYTTSGDVETWKVGATWDTPLDGLRFAPCNRATCVPPTWPNSLPAPASTTAR